MNCKEARDLLIECVTGTETPDRRRTLVGHLEDCSSCRTEALRMEEMVGMLRTVPEPHLPEGHWAQFMAALDRRLAEETRGWRRLIHLFRTPRVAWSTAAATSIVVVTLGIALLVQPFSQPDRTAEDESQVDLSGVVTESVVQSLPSMTTSLASWRAGFSAPDVSYELISVGGK